MARWWKFGFDLWDLPLMALGFGVAVAAQPLLGVGDFFAVPAMIALPALRRALVRNPEALTYELATSFSGSPLTLVLVGLGIVLVLFGLAATALVASFVAHKGADWGIVALPATPVLARVALLVWARRLRR